MFSIRRQPLSFRLRIVNYLSYLPTYLPIQYI